MNHDDMDDWSGMMVLLGRLIGALFLALLGIFLAVSVFGLENPR